MDKYLRLYAEPEVAALDVLATDAGLVNRPAWSHVLVIPAQDETPGFLRPPPPSSARSLMILVINGCAGAHPQVHKNNQALADAVERQFELRWSSSAQFTGFELRLYRDQNAPRDILVVNRFSPGRELPAREGVGLARKIGADMATGLIHRGLVQSPWVHCSDADVRLPQTYFTFSDSITDPAECSALVYPYVHHDDAPVAGDEAVGPATDLYELSLRYYVAGMRFAGSPYAFHTIGSTMVVNARHYAQVRGFPKREAGEDFYLLNKLAKVGQVREFEASEACLPIRITARRSYRVPFGTGAAVNKITALGDPASGFRFYHPESFALLKLWLQALPQYWEAKSTDLTTGLSVVPAALLSGLNELGAVQALEHAFRQSKSEDQYLKQMHTWFDAFRTLKLVHYLRDHHLPSVSYADVCRQRVFWIGPYESP